MVVKVDNGGVISGDAVVLALGPWTSKLLGISSKFRVYELGFPNFFPRPTGEVYICGPFPVDVEVLDRPYLVFPDPEAMQMLKRAAGEVYICGAFPMDVEVPDKPYLVFPDPEAMQMLKRAAGIDSSHLDENSMKVKSEQAGLLPATNDELPIMGEIPGKAK